LPAAGARFAGRAQDSEAKRLVIATALRTNILSKNITKKPKSEANNIYVQLGYAYKERQEKRAKYVQMRAVMQS
jgi:hypothetical protein